MNEYRLNNKKIILGVTGSIAAYKSCEIVRLLQRNGCEVKVVMTEAAQKFITSLTFESLIKDEVITELFPAYRVVKTRHISYAEWADLILVCPATANIIGKSASGIADDFLSTVIMASRAPVLFAPAMDCRMIENEVYLSNCRKLESYGYKILPTDQGLLASGLRGKGRLIDPNTIFEAVKRTLLSTNDLKGKKIVITAGPTRESLDPVRFLTNRSSGKMGYALAEEAALRGAEVCLISGPSECRPFQGINFIGIETAEEMYSAVCKEFEDCDGVIMAAAVSDFTPETVHDEKIKKQSVCFQLKLKKTKDILLKLGKDKNNRVLIGFAVETGDLSNNAVKKLKEKNLDMICVNNPLAENGCFGTDTNKLLLIHRNNKKEQLAVMPKWQVSIRIIDHMVSLLNSRKTE